MEGNVAKVAAGVVSMIGARLEVEEFYPFYENVQPNVVLVQAVGDNTQALGIKLDEPVARPPGSGASTDFGNVSQVMPAFELRYAVSEEPVASHTREMSETAVTDLALQRTAGSQNTEPYGQRSIARRDVDGGRKGRVRRPQQLTTSLYPEAPVNVRQKLGLLA